MAATNYLKKISGTAPENPRDFLQGNLYDIIFRECFFPIKRFVLSHGGEEDDLNDILQDTFLIVSTKVPEEKLQDKSILNAYIFGISRNLWRKELERRKICESKLDEYPMPEEVSDENEFYLELQQRYKLYWKYFIQMGQECRKIIQAFIKKVETKEMSDKFGYTTENYYKRKSLCLKALQTKIKQDPMYNRLKTT